MYKWKCTVCGWIYDPEGGVLVEGIEACTPFEDFPDDFKCPKCGVGKDKFVELGWEYAEETCLT